MCSGAYCVSSERTVETSFVGSLCLVCQGLWLAARRWHVAIWLKRKMLAADAQLYSIGEKEFAISYYYYYQSGLQIFGQSLLRVFDRSEYREPQRTQHKP
eukprot:11866001-Heterocapsa_arctica.AAC.1